MTSTPANGTKTNNKERESTGIKTETFTKETGSKIRPTDMASIGQRQAAPTKGSGRMICNMVVAKRLGLTEVRMKGSIETEIRRARGRTNMLMGVCTRDSGPKIR